MSSPHANVPNVRKNASLSHSWKVSSFLKIKKLDLKNKNKIKAEICLTVLLRVKVDARSEEQLPFLCETLTWKGTLCPRLEAITLGVRFKTFVCQHDRGSRVVIWWGGSTSERLNMAPAALRPDLRL